MTTETNDAAVVITGGSSQTPIPPRVAAPPTISMTHGEKLQKFNGQNFKRWQKKMPFYLSTLGLVRFLTEDSPTKNDDEQDRDYLIAREAQNNSDYLCRYYVMNYLSYSLYDVYSAKKLAKELWESLDWKYKTKDAKAKKFVVSRFLGLKWWTPKL